MRTVSFLKQKGGAGGSTLAVHLAVAAAEEGRRVAIVDVDAQRSASSWGAARGGIEPKVISCHVARLPATLTAAEGDGYDLVIVDTPGRSDAATAAVARLTSLAIVPTRPSAFDLAAVPAVVDIIRGEGTRGCMVLNACPARAREVDEAREVLAHCGLPVWEGSIGDRTVFRRAVSSGDSVTEVDPRGRAAEEIRSLWQYVSGLLRGADGLTSPPPPDRLAAAAGPVPRSVRGASPALL